MTDSQPLLAQIEPKQRKVIEAEPQLRSIRFSPCGKMLAGGGYDARVRRWEFTSDDTPELPALEGHHAWVEAIAFRSEGELLFSGDSWGQLRCWSNYLAETPALKWQQEAAHDGWIRDLAVSSDGKLLGSCGSDRVLRVWSVDDGTKQHELANYGQDLLRLRFLPEGTLITGDDRGIVKLWQLDGTLVREFDASSLYLLHRLQDVGGAHALAVDAEGKTLAVGGTVPKGGGTVIGIPTVLLFDVATGELKQSFPLGTENDCFVADLHFDSRGFLSVVTYGTPGSGQLIYLVPGEEAPLFTYKQMANCHSQAWHPDGKRLVVAATNAGSNGNGRPLDKEGNYPGNKSPLHLFDLPQA
jgi:WD40 repeat protein